MSPYQCEAWKLEMGRLGGSIFHLVHCEASVAWVGCLDVWISFKLGSLAGRFPEAGHPFPHRLSFDVWCFWSSYIFIYIFICSVIYIYYIYILYFNIHNPCAPDSLRNLFVSSRVWRPWPKQAMKVIGSPPPRRTFAFSATLCRSRPTWICGMVRCDFSGTLEVDQKFITADGEMLVQGLRECRCVRAAQLRVLWS